MGSPAAGSFGPGTALPPELETGPITDTATPVTPRGVAGAAALLGNPATAIPAITVAANDPSISPLATLVLGGGPPPAQGALFQPGETPQGAQPAAPPVAAPAVAAAPAPKRGGGGAPAQPDNLQQDINKIGQQEEAGIRATQEAKTEGAANLEQAQQDLSVQQRMDAQELADRQEQNRQANVHMEEQERTALDKAKNYTIPDFWEGKEGARVGSVISAAAGAISAGILGGPNNALATINKYTDDYFHRQKEKVDNLYRYAEQTGRLNNETRLRYAQELTQLQAQHVAVQQSIITRIESVKSHNQGMVDSAALDGMLAAAKADQVKRVEDYRMNNAHIAQMRAATAASYANAAESRAKANALKEGKADQLAVRDPGTGEILGNAQTPRQVQQIGQQLNASRVYIESLEALKADVEQNGHILDPFNISDSAKNRQQLFNDAVAKGRAARGLGVSNANLALEHGAFGGSGVGFSRTITPQVIDNMIRDARDKSQGLIRSLVPVKGAAPAQAAPAQGGGQQIPVGTRATSGGKPIVMTANGWQYAS